MPEQAEPKLFTRSHGAVVRTRGVEVGSGGRQPVDFAREEV